MKAQGEFAATSIKVGLVHTVIAAMSAMGASAYAQTAQAGSSSKEGTTEHTHPAAIVDALKDLAGNPKAVRATFAKGQCVRGTYTPSKEVSQVTRSLSFTRPSRVLARFSVGGGNPEVADANKAVLRGFSFRLEGSGHSSDILVENAPVHFARNLDQMLGFLKARIHGPDGSPDAERIKAFSAANPETLNQSKFIAGKPLPGSFAGISYWGVHSFPATNAKGNVRFIKFKVVPVGGDITLTDGEAKAKPADFLVQDLEQRIAEGKVQFHVLALLDRPADPTTDVTIRWPDEDGRESVRLGTIRITAIEKKGPCDASIFNPGNLAEGIGQPPDEIYKARLTAYAISLARRRSEEARRVEHLDSGGRERSLERTPFQ